MAKKGDETRMVVKYGDVEVEFYLDVDGDEAKTPMVFVRFGSDVMVGVRRSDEKVLYIESADLETILMDRRSPR